VSKKRFSEITLMNAFLCFAVVIIHLTSSPLSALTGGSVPHLLVFFVNKVLCFSVPSFIFLSGFKLYAKFGDGKVDVWKFYKGRLTKIIVPYLISVAVYFLYFLNKGWVAVSDLPEYYFLGTLVAHFYYVIIAVQLYLLFPIIKYLFDKIPVAVTLVSLASTVIFGQFLFFTYSDRFFGTYIFYFVLGMVFARYKPFEKIKRLGAVSVAAWAVMTAVHMSLSYFSNIGRITYNFAGVVNIVYVITAIFAMYGVFIILGNQKGILNYASVIGGVSYEVYLYHILAIFLLQYDVYPRYSFSVSEMLLISTVTVFVLIHVFAYTMNYLHRRKTAK